MRRTRAKEIHSTAYLARINAVEMLRDVGLGTEANVPELYRIADALRDVSDGYGQAPNAEIYAAFAELIQIVGLLIEWRLAVLNAGLDPHRFANAAKARSAAWIARYSANQCLGGLRKVAQEISDIQAITDVQSVAAALSATPLPIGIYSLPKSTAREFETLSAASEQPAPELTVAFLKFTVDGRPVEETHYLSPREAHDLDIEVRVSRWPTNAISLVLEPVTIEQSGTYQLPTFTFAAPMGSTGPFRLTQQGRAALTVPQHLQARPFEFIYSARFTPVSAEQPVEVVGQRTLLLEGVDLARNPLTGYPSIDRKLIEIRNTLRVLSSVSQQEISDALILAFALGNYTGQVAQDNLIESIIDEEEFQKRIRAFLRSQARIGAELEEHAHVGGGVTDLSFRGIRVELKVEAHRNLTVSDCGRFVGQTASYTASSGKHLGILCVLDCSEKERPPFPPEDGITVLPSQQRDGSRIYIMTFLLQGNLARPSSFSH